MQSWAKINKKFMIKYNMKTVILAGGLGTRMREETEYKPKPMVEIGGFPIIWHIMKSYSMFSHRDFVVCTGYKGEMIKEYFREFETLNSDFTINLEAGKSIKIHNSESEINWSVTLADTGGLTTTGGRILKVRKYLDNQTFMCTYGDGLSDINITELINFHRSHGKVATLTCIRPVSRFGKIKVDSTGVVKQFQEKPQTTEWVNGGFFVFEPQIFNYLSEDKSLEEDTVIKLINDSQLMAFKHDGFWQPMDTYRDVLELNKVWDSGLAPWKKW
jgi:glucose-1-phosphate cytidylyltransferase